METLNKEQIATISKHEAERLIHLLSKLRNNEYTTLEDIRDIEYFVSELEYALSSN